MTHLKTLNAIYSKPVFCDLVTFRSKPLNCFMLPAMSCSRRSCCNDPDSFCYICGEYILKEYKGLLQILFAKYTVLTLELNLVTKTSHGLHMLSANHVLSTYECGQKEKLKALDLVCQWCGENRKTTLMIVTFVW